MLDCILFLIRFGKQLTFEQHWAWLALGWETSWELQLLLTKTKAGLLYGSMLAKQMGGKLLQGIQAQRKSGLCSRWLKSNPPEYWPLEWGCKSQKIWVGRSQVQNRCLQGLFNVESPFKSTLPRVICIHTINWCVRCIGWLYVWFTCERYDMSSKTKRFS